LFSLNLTGNYKMSIYLLNKGKRWDSIDDESLRKMYDSDEKSVLEIAKSFQRTAGAIVARLKILKMVRGDIMTDEYINHIRGWQEYLDDIEFREIEKATKPKTSPSRTKTNSTKSVQVPCDEFEEFKDEVRAELSEIRRLLNELSKKIK
jgi:hypothetical protein